MKRNRWLNLLAENGCETKETLGSESWELPGSLKSQHPFFLKQEPVVPRLGMGTAG